MSLASAMIARASNSSNASWHGRLSGLRPFRSILNRGPDRERRAVASGAAGESCAERMLTSALLLSESRRPTWKFALPRRAPRQGVGKKMSGLHEVDCRRNRTGTKRAQPGFRVGAARAMSSLRAKRSNPEDRRARSSQTMQAVIALARSAPEFARQSQPAKFRFPDHEMERPEQRLSAFR